MLVKIIDKSTNREAEESEDDFWASISPYKGFAKPYKLDTKLDDLYDKKGDDRSFMTLLKEHVAEALEFGFDDSMAKFRGKSHFTAPTIKIWYDSFKILHKIFIENPDNPTFEANDPDYVRITFRIWYQIAYYFHLFRKPIWRIFTKLWMWMSAFLPNAQTMVNTKF
jgi:protein SMG8